MGRGQNTYEDVGPQDLVVQSWAVSSHKDPLFPHFDILRILPCGGITCCCSQDFFFSFRIFIKLDCLHFGAIPFPLGTDLTLLHLINEQWMNEN